MIHAIARPTPKKAETERCPAPRDPAVAHCHQIWERVYRSVLKYQKSRVLARIEAGTAFREALPPLVGSENIRDFIACVCFGMASGVVMEDTGTNLLFAAKVALNAMSARPKNKIPKTE
jgi:hypothetical protein